MHMYCSYHYNLYPILEVTMESYLIVVYYRLNRFRSPRIKPFLYLCAVSLEGWSRSIPLYRIVYLVSVNLHSHSLIYATTSFDIASVVKWTHVHSFNCPPENNFQSASGAMCVSTISLLADIHCFYNSLLLEKTYEWPVFEVNLYCLYHLLNGYFNFSVIFIYVCFSDVLSLKLHHFLCWHYYILLLNTAFLH